MRQLGDYMFELEAFGGKEAESRARRPQDFGAELRAIRDNAIEERSKQSKRTAAIKDDADLLANLSYSKNPVIEAAQKGESEVEVALLEATHASSSQDSEYLKEVQLQAAQNLAKIFESEGVRAEVLERKNQPAAVVLRW